MGTECLRGGKIRFSFKFTRSNWFDKNRFRSIIHYNDVAPWKLTHWGRVTHISVVELTIIGTKNGLSPRRRQAIIWTNASILLIGPLGTKFSDILIEILRVSFKKIRLKGSSAKWRPYCLGLNVLIKTAIACNSRKTNPHKWSHRLQRGVFWSFWSLIMVSQIWQYGCTANFFGNHG